MDSMDFNSSGCDYPWFYYFISDYSNFENSLFDVKILSGVNKFVGLANYVNVFKDPKVQTSISFTVEFVVVSMVFHVVLGVILALILNMKFKGRRFLRTIVLIPWLCRLLLSVWQQNGDSTTITVW